MPIFQVHFQLLFCNQISLYHLDGRNEPSYYDICGNCAVIPLNRNSKDIARHQFTQQTFAFCLNTHSYHNYCCQVSSIYKGQIY